MLSLNSILRYLPYWAIPVILIFGELGLTYRRKGRKLQYTYFALGAIFGLLVLTWFAFRGDLNSDRWGKAVIQGMRGTP